MKMSFIGAGKVGTAFGIYLKKKGFIVNGYYSKTYRSAQKVSEITSSRCYGQLDQLKDSDIIWITTNDDAIEIVANELANLDWMDDQYIIAHMSGVHGSSVLDVLREKGCSVYSVHPLQAFADPITAVEALENTVFTIEGSKKKLTDIESIFNKTGNQYFIIDEKGKTLYHAGACVLSNYLVTLMDSAFNLFEKAGLERSKILDATLPLILGTLNNINLKDTKEALTGPIQRNDIHTIDQHLSAINEQLPEELDFYKYMGLKTVNMVLKNKSEDQLDALNQVFKGGNTHE